jgi:hypothetical protein
VAALWLGFAVFTACFGLLQHMASGFGLTGWMLGVRTYWLYMPLAFVVAAAFRREDVMRFLRLNLWIALPYAVLVASQYSAGPGAFINRGVGGDEEGAVGLGDGILRPFGLFTYTGPNVQFTAAMIAMFTAVFLAKPARAPGVADLSRYGGGGGRDERADRQPIDLFPGGVILGFTCWAAAGPPVQAGTCRASSAYSGSSFWRGCSSCRSFPTCWRRWKAV